MYPLVETIKVLDGDACNLPYHQQRLEFAFANFFNSSPSFKLREVISVPKKFSTGLVKLRFLYSKDDFRLAFSDYEYRIVSTLRIIENNDINYEFKFTNRHEIELLLKQKGDFDDILIVKNNLITDTSIANIVFHNTDGWLTPASPLLKGTCRQRLLFEGKIQEAVIRLSDLKIFDSFCLINAMHWRGLLPIPIENIG